METFLTTPDKRGVIVPFKPNPQQIRMAHDETGRDLTVKARQTGTSSWKIARRIRRLTNGEVFGANALIAADKDATTIGFRRKVQHHLRDLRDHGFEFVVPVDNDKELVIAGLENRILWGSGEQEHIARSYTATEVHLSEFGWWNSTTAASLIGEALPAVPPTPYGNVDIESTAAGDSGPFFELAQASKPLNPSGEFAIHFYPWWIEPHYRVAVVGSDVYADIYLSASEYASMVSSFSPSDVEARLMEVHGLVVDQILWRRLKKARQDMSGAPFAQEFPEDLDACWLGQEGRYFDTPDGIDHLEYYRSIKRNPVVFMEKLPWHGAEVHFFGQNLAIWETPKPGSIYVAFGDAAGGSTTKDSDYTCIVVWDAAREKVVARCQLKCSPKHAGAVMCAIGYYYNLCLTGWERSAHGETAIDEQRELQYPTDGIYRHIDPFRGLRQNEIPQPGIYPSPQNRQRGLEKFKEGITYQRVVSEDPLGASQMSGFTWQRAAKRMKAQAAEGQHDDWIMAAVWGYYILEYALMRMRRRPTHRSDEIVVGAHGLVVSRRTPESRLGPRKAWFR